MAKRILCMVGAGLYQAYGINVAHSMGYEVLAIDMDPHAPGFKTADYRMLCSTKDVAAILSELTRFAKREQLAGVMTVGAEVSPTVAAIAQQFGFPGVSEETAYLTTNKCARSQRLAQQAIPIAQFVCASTYEELVSFPLPFVIKPSDSSASRGVRIVDDLADIQEAFSDAKAYSSDGYVLAEELMSGPEVSIEGIVVDSEVYVTGFGDRNYSRNADFYPEFVEDGIEVPSILPLQMQQEITDCFIQGVKALNIAFGPVKGDMIYTSKGARIIEITSRLSGGAFCSHTVPYAGGIDIVPLLIKQVMGEYIDIEALRGRTYTPDLRPYAVQRFYFHQPGVIQKITGMDKLAQLPGIRSVEIVRPFKVGDILQPAAYVNRLFYVIAAAEERDLAIKYAEDAINSVKIVIKQ